MNWKRNRERKFKKALKGEREKTELKTVELDREPERQRNREHTERQRRRYTERLDRLY